jgi:kynurenine formamidase
VLIRTGWGSRWPDKKTYLGTDAPGDVENLHFPGISPQAAELLAARGIAAVGIDTASMDPGASRDFRTHQILSAAQIPGLENVANLDQLPPRGALVLALPMKIGGGSGAPCRIVALIAP